MTMNLSIGSNTGLNLFSIQKGHISTSNKALARLTTGLRVINSKDDPTSLSIASRYTTEIRSANAVSANANDGIAMLQIAADGLAGIADILTRMDEIAVEGSAATTTTSERVDLQEELDGLAAQVQAYDMKVTYKNRMVLHGTTMWGPFQAGIEAGDQIDYPNIPNTGPFELNVGGLSVASVADSQTAATAIETATNTVNEARGEVAGIQSRLFSAANVATSRSTAITMARTRILDADMALEAANLAKSSVLQNVTTALMSAANQTGSSAYNLLFSQSNAANALSSLTLAMTNLKNGVT